MKRFLVAEKLVVGARLRLSSEESKHAARVMRLAVGDSVLLSDGRGGEAKARLVSVEKAGTWLEVISVRELATRPFRVELVQGLLKGPRMDWLVEKATELGVDVVHTVDSQFSVAGDRAERWRRVAQAAVKQSGNPRLPEIHEAATLADVLGRFEADHKGFLLSPSAETALAKSVAEAGAAGVFVLAVGPEGGFSAEEEALLRERGFTPCALSTQILRGETAALAAAAIALHTLELASGETPGI